MPQSNITDKEKELANIDDILKRVDRRDKLRAASSGVDTFLANTADAATLGFGDSIYTALKGVTPEQAKQIKEGFELIVNDPEHPIAAMGGKIAGYGALAAASSALGVTGALGAAAESAAEALGLGKLMTSLGSTANVNRLLGNAAKAAGGQAILGGAHNVGTQQRDISMGHMKEFQVPALLNDIMADAATGGLLHLGGAGLKAGSEWAKGVKESIKSPAVLKAEAEAAEAAKKSAAFKQAQETVASQKQSAVDRLNEIGSKKDALKEFIDKQTAEGNQVHPSVRQQMNQHYEEAKGLIKRVTDLGNIEDDLKAGKMPTAYKPLPTAEDLAKQQVQLKSGNNISPIVDLVTGKTALGMAKKGAQAAMQSPAAMGSAQMTSGALGKVIQTPGLPQAVLQYRKMQLDREDQR